MGTTALRVVDSSANSQTLSREQSKFMTEFSLIPVKHMDDLVSSTMLNTGMVDRQALTLGVASLIGDYLNYVGLSSKMNDQQIYETAEMMIDNHPNVTVDVFKTFFYDCKRGKFGYHYDEMNGTRILMWYDKFVEDLYRQIDDYEYAKHQNTKGDLANPANLTDEEGEPIDLTQLLASFHGKTKEQLEREKKIADIRYAVLKKYTNLYDTMPVDEADKIIEDALTKEFQAQGLLTF